MMLLTAIAVCPVLADDTLSIQIQGEQNTYQLGTILNLRLLYENIGEDVFYIELSSDYGPGHLNLVLTNGRCQYSINPIHFDRSLGSHRFDFVPLRPNSTHGIDLIPLNHPGGGVYLQVPHSGSYSLTAIFNSEGPLIEGSFWPIWRGSVKAAPIPLEVTSPERSTLEEWNKRLSNCAAEQFCEDLDAIDYFQLVRDSRAPELLKRLLRKDASLYSLAGEALVHQGRREDADFLRQLSNKSSLSVDLRIYYGELASRIDGRSQECW